MQGSYSQSRQEEFPQKTYSEVPSSDLAAVSIWAIKRGIFRCKSNTKRIRTLTLTYPRVCSLPPSAFSGSVQFDQIWCYFRRSRICHCCNRLCSLWWFNCSVCVHEQLRKPVCAVEMFNLIRIWCHFRRNLYFHCWYQVHDGCWLSQCSDMLFFHVLCLSTTRKCAKRMIMSHVLTSWFDKALILPQKAFMISLLISSSWQFLTVLVFRFHIWV